MGTTSREQFTLPRIELWGLSMLEPGLGRLQVGQVPGGQAQPKKGTWDHLPVDPLSAGGAIGVGCSVCRAGAKVDTMVDRSLATKAYNRDIERHLFGGERAWVGVWGWAVRAIYILGGYPGIPPACCVFLAFFMVDKRVCSLHLQVREWLMTRVGYQFWFL